MGSGREFRYALIDQLPNKNNKGKFMTRKENDKAIATLLKHWHVFPNSEILDCCSGDGHLVEQLESQVSWKAHGGDISSRTFWFDAASYEHWDGYGQTDYVITNPPSNKVMQILPLAKDFSNFGVAMLLGLNFLEPCKSRVNWLIKNPISKIILIAGDSKTAWFVWDKMTANQEIIVEPFEKENE